VRARGCGSPAIFLSTLASDPPRREDGLDVRRGVSGGGISGNDCFLLSRADRDRVGSEPGLGGGGASVVRRTDVGGLLHGVGAGGTADE